MATGTIVINDDLRTMQIPDSITLLGVESDDDVNKIAFQMPKEYSGFDLSTFQARINYMNANGDGDVYIVQDLAEDGDDPSLMNFTWLVGRNACAYIGNTKFIVCLKKFDADSNVVQEFNTTVYSLPVLEGLETTEAVVQQNPDIIEYILQMIDEAGIVDFSNYYTKTEVDALIPTKLPNPYALSINGTDYDGSEAVSLTLDGSEYTNTAEGTLVHVADAIVNEPFKALSITNDGAAVNSADLVIANKNLAFGGMSAGDIYSSKNINFTFNEDGSVRISGTSTGTYPSFEFTFFNNENEPAAMFEVGKTYTLSTGKTEGVTYLQLALGYKNSATIDYIVARNAPRTFTITQEVDTATLTVQLTDSGVTVDNEIIYPQLEVGALATSYEQALRQNITYDGSQMPSFYWQISNMWCKAGYDVEVEYVADKIESEIDAYVQNQLATGHKANINTEYDANTLTLKLKVG